jgi:hypothetical protein
MLNKSPSKIKIKQVIEKKIHEKPKINIKKRKNCKEKGKSG